VFPQNGQSFGPWRLARPFHLKVRFAVVLLSFLPLVGAYTTQVHPSPNCEQRSSCGVFLAVLFVHVLAAIWSMFPLQSNPDPPSNALTILQY
jgi:hypothetical protein